MAFTDPGSNVLQFGLKEGQCVADLGAGVGMCSMPLARSVGATGRVYAVEIQKELLERLKRQAREEGLGNIEVLWGDIESKNGTKLRDKCVDVALLSNVLFQVDDKNGVINEVSRILKHKGRVCIIEWSGSYNDLGPQEEMVVPANVARELFERAGYVYEGEISAGKHHYGISMSKV